jgi:membrane protein YdbS with pleckstrin-like domain
MTDLQLRDPEHRVSTKAPVIWVCLALGQAIIGVAALWLVTGPWNWFSMPWWAWVGYAVVALAYLVLMPMIRYRVHRWESTETAVFTQTGWLTRERRIAPMSRVQTVDFEQGAISRMVGLASVTVTTASAAGPLKIHGLDKDVAERLVDELTRRTQAEPGDAT